MPPSKRIRRSQSEIRDPKLYFDDGSVVLSSKNDPDDEDTQVTYFRVHKTMLANASTIFRDIFQLPQPPSESAMAGKDTYDGLPLIVLHDETADLRDFLRVIYDPIPIFADGCDDIVGEIGGSLKLAKKYEASALYDHLIQLIKKDWPEDSSKWNDRSRKSPSAEALIHLSWTSDARQDLRVPLALAYYDLSLRGLEKCDQSLLNTEDLVIVMEGYKNLVRWLLDYADDCRDMKFPPCDLCEKGFRTPADFVMHAITSQSGPLKFVQMESACSSCSTDKNAFELFLVLGFSGALPSFFLGPPIED